MRRIETPEGLLFFDRDTGLHVLFDELRGRYQWVKPLYVAVQVTNRCNRACRFCYANAGPGGKTGIWTTEKMLELCRFLDSFGVLGVSFGGGEPFTFPDFAVMCRKVWDSTGLDVGATSNGDLITAGDLETMRGHFGQLRVSVWHPNEIRGKVARLLGKGVSIGVNTILFSNGLKLVEEIVDEGARAGIDDFLILSCKPAGRADGSLAPKPEDITGLKSLFDSHPQISFKTDPELAVALKGSVEFAQPWVEEGGGTRFLSITWDGYVKPNSFTELKVPMTGPESIPEIYARFARQSG